MFKTLSVAETNYDSDRIVFEHHSYQHDQTLRVEVTAYKSLILKSGNNKIEISHFKRSDLRSLILALQEADTFLSEAELVEKLMGK